MAKSGSSEIIFVVRMHRVKELTNSFDGGPSFQRPREACCRVLAAGKEDEGLVRILPEVFVVVSTWQRRHET